MTTTLAAPAGADATTVPAPALATAPAAPASNDAPTAPAPIADEDAAAPAPIADADGPATPSRLRRLGRALAAPRWRRPLWAGGLILLGKVLVPAVLALVGARGAAALAADWIAEGALAVAALIALVPIAQKAWRAARAKQMSIDVLVTIATVGALAIGEVWEAAAVTFLFLVGHALEETTLASTRSALDELIASVPATALVVRDGRRVEVPAWAVERGERVVIADGARIPVDGVLLEGAGSVDEAGITGEPLPREVGTGDSVHAGTTARGAFLLEATRVGADTTVAKIVARVEDAQNAKARVQTFMESFSAWYTPAIVVASIVLGILTRDVRLALTLLVISCPGALVISIPVATVAGIGAGAKRGILIRGGDKLEAAAKVDVVALDKTGTLTKGRPAVVAVLPAPAAPSARSSAPSFAIDEDAVLELAAALEASSAHPLAEAVLEAAHARGIDPAARPASEVESVTGRGLTGLVEGRRVLVGTARFLDEEGVDLSGFDPATIGSATPVLVGVEGLYRGAILIADEVRPDAAGLVADLRRLGVRRIVMLTGDRKGAAEEIARATGVDEVRAELLPEDKVATLEELRARGARIAMIGDGVNDAPALATADIGIAMGASGSNLAIEAADIAVLRDEIGAVAEGLGLARRTAAVMRANVVIAIAVVALLIAGVLAGGVTMAIGMLVHEASVLVVILNAIRLLRVKG